MDNLEIFDKDGKALHIGIVISRFIKLKAAENKRDETTIYIKKEKGRIELRCDDGGFYRGFTELEEISLNGL